MDKNLKVVFWKGTTPTTFEVEVKYASEDVEKLFGITYNEDLYGLLYCDEVTDGESACKLKKTFDYKNKKIILEIGN